MRHILSVLLENESGALARVVGLFAQRGYNIDSLTVAATEDPTISRLTLVTRGDDQVIEQITKQLHKLIDVHKVFDYLDTPMLERELVLLKVQSEPERRAEILQLVEIFRGKVVDIADRAMVIEVTGGGDKIDSFEKQMEPFGIRELVRTGRIAMMRGSRTV